MADKVLLVDDDPEFLEAMADRMRARGMDVDTAESASAALPMAAKTSYDAIILDLLMPGMDGIEALRALKADEAANQIILLTGHGTVEKGIEAMKLGAMDFLEKPADINVLSEKIKEAKAKKMIIAEERVQEKLKDILSTKSW